MMMMMMMMMICIHFKSLYINEYKELQPVDINTVVGLGIRYFCIMELYCPSIQPHAVHILIRAVYELTCARILQL